MNAKLFRLVFNKTLGMYVPAHEATRTRGKDGCRSAAAAALMLIATLAHGRPPVAAPAADALPVPSNSKPFVYSGSGGASTAGATMTIQQNSRTLGLNWNSFNIGANATVNVNQPDAAARVLNRIWDANPSVIMGRLNANGQVYLLNQNGILFGNGAQVNVGGLVASALSVTDNLLDKGLPGAAGDSLSFTWGGDATGFLNGFVAVDPGATLTTPAGGKIVLLAPRTVENLGHIDTGAGGEAILAAGGSVLLTAPADPNLRGLLVEVKSWKGVDSLGNNVTLNGEVANQADGVADSGNGEIAAPQGVVTLAALAVNQSGAVNAAKAINLNGEIMLVAGPTQADHLTVTQISDKAEIDWKAGFNVKAEGNEAVRFKSAEFIQPESGAVAYNFVYDPDRQVALDGSKLDNAAAGRSTIDGKLTANGQWFLVNEKGIDFGAAADVRASNFAASALGINPDAVATGLYSQDGVSSRTFYLSKNQWLAATEGDFAIRREAALAVFRDATVNVAKGATISTVQNGYAMLLGGQVNQAGTITTPGGQALLAAGAEVYLKPPYSQGLRGFTTEVNPLYLVQGWTSNDTWEAVSRGADANRVTNTGTVRALFGNITLVGYEIEQAGSLLASTSVTRNGSIRLLARDQVASQGLPAVLDGEPPVDSGIRKRDAATGQIVATGSFSASTEDEAFVVGRTGGALTLAKGSRTEVALDGSDHGTITAEQSFLASSIEAAAAKVHAEGSADGKPGAVVSARGGRISLTASELFDVTNAFPTDPLAVSNGASPSTDAGIFIGGGAVLDASGAVASKSASDLFIEVELRGDEFANNPLQREGKLRGEKAWVDIRDKVAVADLTGYFGKVGQTLEERAATGGDIALRSGGSLIVKQDAVLDVSGGQVDYAAGVVQESRAVTLGGKSYRLNDAPADAAYSGLITLNRREAAYTEGKSSGSVELTSHSIALDGTLLGRTVRGERQRNLGDPATDRYAVPKGAKLIVRDAGQHYTPAGTGEADRTAAYGQAQIRFITGPSTAATPLAFGDQAGPRLDLSQSLVDAGFSRFDIRSDGLIDLPADVTLRLAAGGEFKASGRQVAVGGGIIAPGGSISLSTRDLSLAGIFPGEAKYSPLLIGDGATLSTAGRWVNDRLVVDPTDYDVLALDGGSITLDSAYDIVVRTGAELDVSGGARVRGDGRLDAGNAGSIRLSSGRFGLLDATDAQDSGVFLDGRLSAYALGKGGRLEISTSQIRFGKPLDTLHPDASRAERLALANDADPTDLRRGATTFGADFLDRGGFFDFKFTGRDGLTVTTGTTLAPKPLSWSLLGVLGYTLQTSGTRIDSFARTLSLPWEMRAAPTSLTLATRSVPYGDLTIGQDAWLKVDPAGSITLESWRQLTVLGALEARGGSIRLTRPAYTYLNGREGMLYTSELQSRSIYLGADAQLLAGGVTKLDAATRTALDTGASAEELRVQGRYRGEVLAGGRVDLDAGQGYLITRPGSLIDVSGASDTLSIATRAGQVVVYRTAVVGSAGGHVSLSARDGMFLNGSYAAVGGPGGTFSLRLADVRADIDPWQTAELSESDAVEKALRGPRQLTLYQSAVSHDETWPTGMSEADYLAGRAVLDPVQHNGKVRLDFAPLAAAGFGSWYLASQDQMDFEGTINATVANQLRLDSHAFAAHSDAADVSLIAAAIQIGNYASPVLATPTPGGARFRATARDLALVGSFTWSGFGNSSFTSRGELHFDAMPHGVQVGNRTVNAFDGTMLGTGSVEFSAARVSPSTYSTFVADLSSDPAARLSITRPDQVDTPAPLLSVGGSLEFKAPAIEQRGTIVAPLGRVVFDAGEGVATLAADSITSVSADSALPLGQTSQSGRLWEFVAGTWNPTGGGLANTSVEVTSPRKEVIVNAADSAVHTGAQIDLSGGGEAVAWEFSPGPGGKLDILAPTPGQEPKVFAILPGWSGNFAPADAQNQAGYNVSAPRTVGSSVVYDAIPSLRPGDQIDLAANPTGLSGRHTLLPARYALLPGAVLVSVKPARDATVAGPIGQADGSWLVSGTRLAANADGSYSAYGQRPLTLELAPQAVVLDRARYGVTTATGFFYDQTGVQLPGNAGHLAVTGRRSLVFDPVIRGRPVEQIASGDGRARAGTGAEIDLAANRMEVIDTGIAASGDGWTSFDKDKLNALGAASLLLGGVRSVEDGSTAIETVASELRIATSGSDSEEDALQAPELLLSATDNVTIAAGSFLAAKGNAPTRDILVVGDGAFVRIAGGAQANVVRQGSVTRTLGDLLVEAEASVSGRALTLDATRHNTLFGTVRLRNLGNTGEGGGALAIGADRINVVGDASAPTEGLTLDRTTLAAFGTPDQLRLTSYSMVDLFGPAELGAATLKELVIESAGLVGHGSSGTTARMLGERISLRNPNPGSASFAADVFGSGRLELEAQTVVFGDNASVAMRDGELAGLALRGFDAVAVRGSSEIRFEGRGVTSVDSGTSAVTRLTLDAGRVIVATGADHLLRASGAGEVKGSGNSGAAGELGGRLDLRADSLDLSGRILAPSGSLLLRATGTGKNVTVETGAVIAAEGRAVAFADTQAYAPAGRINIQSDAGDVVLKQGAVVSVSGAAGGGDAGRLGLLAQTGTVTAVAGTLRGRAEGEGAQGELRVDANVVDVNQLAAAVRETVGDEAVHFTGAWDVRRRSGDLSLTDSVAARQVRFSADVGNVRIGDGMHAGTIDASGAKGGTIELYARNGDVTLTSTGRLLANATEHIGNTANAGTRGQGGTVILGASSPGRRVITVQGSLVDVGVAEGSLARGGKVVFRAEKSASIADKSDLNLQLAGETRGAAEVSAEIVSHYSGTEVQDGSTSDTSLGLASLKGDLDALFTADNVARLRSHLDFNQSNQHIRPGIEITAAGSDFTIASDLDLGTLRFADASGSLTEAGFLTIRSGRDLKISRVISDGFSANPFSDPPADSVSRDALLNSSGSSWSYRLVAGADTSAANPLAVVAAPAVGATAASDPLGLKGGIEIASQKFVRTGTGDITLAARRDIKLFEKATIYSAGVWDTDHPADFTPYDKRSFFPTGGGDVMLLAGQRILMVKNASGSSELTPVQRHVNEWLQRAGTTSGTFFNTQWWPNIASFQQGVAAFGGGDVNLQAGGDIKYMTVAIPTSGRVPGVPGEEARPDQVRIEGGGDLLVRAGGAVQGGLFYAESGKLRIEAEEVKADTAIALGNAQVDIVAGKGAALGDVFNPLWVKHKYVQSNGTPYDYVQDENSVRIGTYSEFSALHVLAVTGNVALKGAGLYGGVKDPTIFLQRVAPSRVWVASLDGDIGGSLTQAPGPHGQLDLLAAGSISLGANGIRQFDVPASFLPSVQAPKLEADVDLTLLFRSALAPTKNHASSAWHLEDAEPSRLIALGGDVSGAGGQSASLFNEPLLVSAAGTLRDLSLTMQHLRDEDVTRISAAGDIRFTISEVINTGRFQVNGPGRLDVLAGGSVDLGAAGGIVTRGNLENPYLPEGGASVFVLAGATPDYAGFRSYLHMGEEVGEAALHDRFFALLREKGREALEGGGEESYEAGREAIRALFPATAVHGGDINFFYSQIKTEQGGWIDLLAPGGGVTVGIANPSLSLSKKAAEQGLFTVRGGDIRALVSDDFLVNQSRVFTMDGGDILIWADQGNIDAGSGAKTVSATPPPVLVIRNGQIVLDTSNSVSGSGIGTLASRADTPPSDLDLFAPRGAIDAGDAGLRSTGNVFLGATQVLNSANIQVGGVAAGLPAAVGITGLSGVTSPAESVASSDEVTRSIGEVGAKSDQAAQEMKQALAAFRPSFVTVEVLGFGDGTTASGSQCRRESFRSDEDYRRCVREQDRQG